MGGSESKAKSSDNPGCLPFGKSGGPKFEISLATLGLDNAGKTSIVLALAKEPSQEVMPTVGFDSKKITFHGHSVTLLDLGGGSKIRGIWKSYLAEAHGILYVVDAADSKRVDESAIEFKNLCNNPLIHGKPMLILANKSDKADALSEYELTEKMDLEEIVNINRIPTKVQASTTTSKDHKTLKDGMKWLCVSIMAEWEELSNRVKQDKSDAVEKQKAERKQRMERIRREREEREGTEGGAQDEEDGATDMALQGDPFQLLDNHLSAKDAETKVKKSKKKKKTPRTPRTPREEMPPEMDDYNQGRPTNAGESLYSHPQLAAPDDDDDIGRPVIRNGDMLLRKPERVPSPLPGLLGDGLGGMSSRLPPLGALPPLSSSSPLKPMDLFSEETTTKKKKKRKKKARISPTNHETDHLNGLMPVQEEES